jgi:hypothetical protein
LLFQGFFIGASTPFSSCSDRPFRVFHVLGEKANS